MSAATPPGPRLTAHARPRRLVLEALADIRDPLDETEGAEARAERQTLEQRLSELQRALEDMRAEKEVMLQSENYEAAGNVKKVRGARARARDNVQRSGACG